MEYASGGELFDRICTAGRFSEHEARYFFQQLISGVSFCHEMQICHKDLKLENTLLDGSPAPRLKICDFSYSKSSLLNSRPKSTVGTPTYIAPEVLSRHEYDGNVVALYIRLPKQSNIGHVLDEIKTKTDTYREMEGEKAEVRRKQMRQSVEEKQLLVADAEVTVGEDAGGRKATTVADAQ
ncbi:hypothetical protein POM88_025336 [Heracleum sosnowskyi]|uniref:non-specific serine/threonine protein kinase n=1 Tax=Heracleum sosnowskyi TaxID=360622 RepID=A0AAD8I3U0_9APIA|nr:hypothetical protein POM88_025336 [Heracleum sosnowskyi]